MFTVKTTVMFTVKTTVIFTVFTAKKYIFLKIHAFFTKKVWFFAQKHCKSGFLGLPSILKKTRSFYHDVILKKQGKNTGF